MRQRAGRDQRELESDVPAPIDHLDAIRAADLGTQPLELAGALLGLQRAGHSDVDRDVPVQPGRVDGNLHPQAVADEIALLVIGFRRDVHQFVEMSPDPMEAAAEVVVVVPRQVWRPCCARIGCAD